VVGSEQSDLFVWLNYQDGVAVLAKKIRFKLSREDGAMGKCGVR